MKEVICNEVNYQWDNFRASYKQTINDEIKAAVSSSMDGLGLKAEQTTVAIAGLGASLDALQNSIAKNVEGRETSLKEGIK